MSGARDLIAESATRTTTARAPFRADLAEDLRRAADIYTTEATVIEYRGRTDAGDTWRVVLYGRRPTPGALAAHRAGMAVWPQHGVETAEERYSGCERAGRADSWDERARGGMVLRESCSCGATRWTLRNGSHEDQGEWT